MHERRFPIPPLLTAAIVVAALLVAGILGIRLAVRTEENRNLQHWKITLGALAETQADAIEQWMAAQGAKLAELARNPSLQMYTQHLSHATPPGHAPDESVQLAYLRNLIHSTGEKNGFFDDQPSDSPIRADIAFHAQHGLALMDRNLNLLAATPGVSPPDAALRTALAAAMQEGTPRLHDYRVSEDGQAVLGFLVPVLALRKQSDRPEVVGCLHAFKSGEQTPIGLVQASRQAFETTTAYLTRKDGNDVVLLSPVKDGAKSMGRRFSITDADLAPVRATLNPGQFGRLPDQAGKDVLFTSREVGRTPWILVQQIDSAEALRDMNTRQGYLVVLFSGALLLTIALLAAAWWYGDSLRQQKTADELKRQTEILIAKSNLLDAISNNSADLILLLGRDNRILFGNAALGSLVGMEEPTFGGKSLATLFGPDPAAVLQAAVDSARRIGKTVTQACQMDLGGRSLVIHGNFTPIVYESDSAETVLITLHDVTQIQNAQRRQASLMRQLIGALMRAIDLHDPYSANHSSRTARIALKIAEHLNVRPELCAALETAASLCNIGKLFIPKDILTKTEPLNREEQNFVRKETLFASEILAGIDFDGPVLEIIVHKHEYLDGSGYPQGLKGDHLILPARILTTANDFVAMITPRAYRNRFEVKDAIATLLQAADTRYDRKVIAALFHVAENEINWQEWFQEDADRSC